ncbi:serine hydrolase domain-containing protein [Nocardioides dongkuii]|uniref:serine hydrolase domain-containing protein n=1 Tax=Nocardioides dongkuii TaxID=2760089 RepID=UPI001877D5C3|nr:serine hydrolase domain-containing protein [Nocardioides dongkuii]
MRTRTVEQLVADAGGTGRPMVIGVRTPDGTRYWSRGPLPDGAASLFEIGSVTKTVTATLLALLAREGTVAYDDPAAAYLPAAPPVVGRPITLADLATHHSGLPRLPSGLLLAGLTRDRRDPYARLDEERLAQAVRETTPTRPPGEKLAYSNLGAGLLGLALARAAGTSYAGLVAARVTGPLGLVDTAVTTPPGAEHRLVPGHGFWGRETGRWDMAALAGAGGLCSTAADVLDLLALHAPGATGPLAEAARETAVPRHPLGSGLSIGLAWLVVAGGAGPARLRLPHDVLWHDGGTGGYRSFAAVVPATGASVVVLSARARGVTGLGLQLVRALT